MKKTENKLFTAFLILSLLEMTLTVIMIKYINNIYVISSGMFVLVLFNSIVFMFTGMKLARKNKIILKKLFKSLIEKDSIIENLNRNLSGFTDEYNKKYDNLKLNAARVLDNIKNKAEAFPVFCNQLDEVTRQTEDAATSLINSFIDINTKVKKQSEIAASFFSADTPDESENIFENNKKVLNNLLSNFNNISAVITDITGGVQVVADKLDGIEKIITDIEAIQEKTHILSINANIVASQQGEKGKAFAVVASEIRKLSDNTKFFVSDIRNIINNTINESKTILSNSGNALKKNMEISENEKLEISELMDKIDSKIDGIFKNFSSLKSMTDELGKNINGIVVSIQFQDITRQKIDHVIMPLKVMYDELSKTFINAENQDNDLTKGHFDLESWINKYYTMENEREILRNTLHDKKKA